jgi:23S rRNA (pseudouridine1915-N3)-methyltransferase
MHLRIVAVGKVRSKDMGALVADYLGRAERYWELDVIEVKEESARSRPAGEVRAREGERLLAAAGAARIVACDEHGTMFRSEEFAGWLRDERDGGARDLAFIVGGAYGLSTGLLERADARMALARWTLPHELARLVLLEQLYRAGTILRGEPYHK